MEGESHQDWICLQEEELLQKPVENLKQLTPSISLQEAEGLRRRNWAYQSCKYSALITALYRWLVQLVAGLCPKLWGSQKVGGWLDKVPCQATHGRA